MILAGTVKNRSRLILHAPLILKESAYASQEQKKGILQLMISAHMLVHVLVWVAGVIWALWFVRCTATNMKGLQGDFVETYPTELRNDGVYVGLKSDKPRWWPF
jgi:hypothetical protein